MIELIAKVAHEVNRAYCEALRDESQVPWEEAEEWQKDSARSGVRLHVETPSLGPEASHEAWAITKLTDGWVYGEIKDPEAKTHPCLVPFEDLPVGQQAKDYIFTAVVRECEAMLREASVPVPQPRSNKPPSSTGGAS